MKNFDSPAAHTGHLTIDAALRLAAHKLARISTTPRLDAELLVMQVCGLSRVQLMTRAGDGLTKPQARRLHELLARRQTGEPMAYLMGTREFWSMEFKVSSATLIPRPETETLVEQTLICIPKDAEWTIVDIGTGCGAVAAALANERPLCRVVATEQAQDTLRVARQNIARHGLSNVELLFGNWLEPLAGKTVDVIVSNPPYVRSEDPHLTTGDVSFEPLHALVAGPDGLDAIRHIASCAKSYLRSRGWLLLEHGSEQARSVADIMRRCGYINIACQEDLAGLDRVSKCQVH